MSSEKNVYKEEKSRKKETSNTSKEKKNIINENYNIEVISTSNSILIIIINITTNKIYENYFNFEYLHKLKIFLSFFSIKEIKDYISSLINSNNIEIEEIENENKINFSLFSNLLTNSKVELILNKKKLSFYDEFEQSKQEIEKLKKKMKNFDIDNLKEKINNIEKENSNLKKEINILKKELESKNLKINSFEKQIQEFKKIINIFERFIFNLLNKTNQKIQLKKSNLKHLQTIENNINSISIFPSGKIITVSNDKSITFYDDKFSIIQKIENAHNQGITNLNIKDENNFVTCSIDKNIKIWIKKNNIFVLYKIIEKAHDSFINKILYLSNGNIISCSLDKTIKIFEEKNNEYNNIKVLKHNNKIFSILLLKDILISSGEEETKFWNLKDYNLIFNINETFCGSWNALSNIDNDKVIVQGKNYEKNLLYVISINKKKNYSYFVYSFFFFWNLFS